MKQEEEIMAQAKELRFTNLVVRLLVTTANEQSVDGMIAGLQS